VGKTADAIAEMGAKIDTEKRIPEVEASRATNKNAFEGILFLAIEVTGAIISQWFSVFFLIIILII